MASAARRASARRSTWSPPASGARRSTTCSPGPGARLFGTGEVGLRSLSALIGCLTVPAAYLAARELVVAPGRPHRGRPGRLQPLPGLVLAGGPLIRAARPLRRLGPLLLRPLPERPLGAQPGAVGDRLRAGPRLALLRRLRGRGPGPVAAGPGLAPAGADRRRGGDARRRAGADPARRRPGGNRAPQPVQRRLARPSRASTRCSASSPTRSRVPSPEARRCATFAMRRSSPG